MEVRWNTEAKQEVQNKNLYKLYKKGYPNCRIALFSSDFSFYAFL